MIAKVRAWMSDDKHEFIVGAVALIILLGLSFAAGRYFAPTSVKTVAVQAKATHDEEKKVEQKVDVHEVQDQQAKTKTVVVYRDRITHPDGTVEEHEKETTVLQTMDFHIDLRSAAWLAAQTVTHDEATVTLKAKEVTRDPPNVEASLLAGFRLSDDIHPVVGPMVQFRALGPLKVGGWAMTAINQLDVSAGITLTVEGRL